MNYSKSISLTFFVRFITTLIIQILSLILNNLILTRYGSDMNGLISTILQIFSFTTLLEGGVTMLALSKLFIHYRTGDFETVNSIISDTSRYFVKISKIILIIGIILSLSFPFFINSTSDFLTIFLLFIVSTLQIFIKFLIFNKFSLVFSLTNKEYIYTFISSFFLIIAIIFSIVAIYYNFGILFQRIIFTIVPFFSYSFYVISSKKVLPSIDFNVNKNSSLKISFFNDVMIQKFSLLVFASTDLIFLSIFSSTIYSSIYSLYFMIFSFVKSILLSLVLSPLNSFGSLDETKDFEKVKVYYKNYFLLISYFIFVLFGSVTLVSLPFLELYTLNVSDANYLSLNYVILFYFTFLIDLFTISLGGIINIKGHFKNMRLIAFTSTIINLILTLLLVNFFNIEGVIIGSIFGYLYMFISLYNLFKEKILQGQDFVFFKPIIVNLIFSILFISLIMLLFDFNFQDYYQFIIFGVIITIFFAVYLFLINVIFLFIKPRFIITQFLTLFKGIK